MLIFLASPDRGGFERPENSPVDCFQWFERPEKCPVDCFQWFERPEKCPVDIFQWFERPEKCPVDIFQRERAGRPMVVARSAG